VRIHRDDEQKRLSKGRNRRQTLLAPSKAGAIDTDALARERDELFAEAVALYRQGARWWPDQAFEIEHIRPQQEARFEADAWQETISDWLKGQTKITVGSIAKRKRFLTGRKRGRRAHDRLRQRSPPPPNASPASFIA
jgi:predicted P-loop ATPase